MLKKVIEWFFVFPFRINTNGGIAVWGLLLAPIIVLTNPEVNIQTYIPLKQCSSKYVYLSDYTTPRKADPSFKVWDNTLKKYETYSLDTTWGSLPKIMSTGEKDEFFKLHLGEKLEIFQCDYFSIFSDDVHHVISRSSVIFKYQEQDEIRSTNDFYLGVLLVIEPVLIFLYLYLILILIFQLHRKWDRNSNEITK